MTIEEQINELLTAYTNCENAAIIIVVKTDTEVAYVLETNSPRQAVEMLDEVRETVEQNTH